MIDDPEEEAWAEMEKKQQQEVGGWRKAQIVTEPAKMCQACRRRVAVKQVKRPDGVRQWRCQTCLDLKNRSGFTKGKQ